MPVILHGQQADVILQSCLLTKILYFGIDRIHHGLDRRVAMVCQNFIKSGFAEIKDLKTRWIL